MWAARVCKIKTFLISFGFYKNVFVYVDRHKQQKYDPFFGDRQNKGKEGWPPFFKIKKIVSRKVYKVMLD